jgi:excisionase family DNA binding protein
LSGVLEATRVAASVDATEPYLTAAQLADLLQVDSATVYRWAQQEASMPALRIRGVVRFPRERVLRWLEEHEQGHARPRRKPVASTTSRTTDL